MVWAIFAPTSPHPPHRLASPRMADHRFGAFRVAGVPERADRPSDYQPWPSRHAGARLQHRSAGQPHGHLARDCGGAAHAIAHGSIGRGIARWALCAVHLGRQSASDCARSCGVVQGGVGPGLFRPNPSRLRRQTPPRLRRFSAKQQPRMALGANATQVSAHGRLPHRPHALGRGSAFAGQPNPRPRRPDRNLNVAGVPETRQGETRTGGSPGFGL